MGHILHTAGHDPVEVAVDNLGEVATPDDDVLRVKMDAVVEASSNNTPWYHRQ